MCKYETLMYYNMILFAIATNVSTALSSVCIVFSVMIMLVQKWKTGNLPAMDMQILKVLSIYAFLQCIVAALSINPSESFNTVWSTMYRFIPLFFAMGYIKSLKSVKIILVAFLFSVLITDIVGAYQFFVLDNHRPKGLSGSATFYASNLLMALPIIYMIVRDGYMKYKWVSLGVMFFSFVMLVLSGTRGGWIALVFVLAALIFLEEKYRKFVVAACIAVGMGCGLLISTNPFIQSRIITIMDTKYQSNSERLLMWQSALAIFKDYPIHGIGQDQFGYMYNTRYISPLAKERGDEDYKKGHGHPHNNFFKSLAEGGIIGVAAFLLLHGYFLYRMILLYKTEKGNAGALCGMIGILIFGGIHLEGMTDTNANQVPIIREYWFLMGMLLSIGNLRNHLDIEAGKFKFLS